MNLSLSRYFRAHRSTLIYSIFQILILFGFEYLVKSYIATDSFLMLVSVILLSVLAFWGAHLIVRFEDINNILKEFFSDTKRIMSKMPLIRKFGFLWM